MKKFKWSYIIVVMLGVGFASSSYAEVKGIDPTTQCLGAVNYISDITKALANLTPEAAAKYYDAANKRFIFCIDPSTQPTPKIKDVTTFTNNTQYPVIIHNLAVDSSSATLGQSLLTLQGSGEIALQNFTATGIKGSLQLQGNSNILTSTITCDASMGNTPAISISGMSGSYKDVTVTGCNRGLYVTGSLNTLTNVTVASPAVADLSGWAITLRGAGNALRGITVTGYAKGIVVAGNNALITKCSKEECGTVLTSDISGVAGAPLAGSVGVTFMNPGTLEYSSVGDFEKGVLVTTGATTSGANSKIRYNVSLGGSKAAVAIVDGVSPVTVMQNTYTIKDAVAYLDNGGNLLSPTDPYGVPHVLSEIKWMGAHLSEKDPTMVDQIVGKLSDQNSTSASVEFYLGKPDDTNPNLYLLGYSQTCPVKSATEPITIKMTDSNGSETKNQILSGEKYFDCSSDLSGNSLNIPLAKIARFAASSPVSFMTENSSLSDWPHVTVLIASQTPVVIGGGDLQTQAPNMDPGNLDPSDGEGSSSHSSGNNSTGDATSLGGEVPTIAGGMGSVAGASGVGGCTLQPTAERTSIASVLVWLIPLLPIPLLIPYRKNHKGE